MDDRQKTQEDLRATSEAIERDAERLGDLEASKQALRPDDPRVGVISEEAVEVAEQVLTKAKGERHLARTLKDTG